MLTEVTKDRGDGVVPRRRDADAQRQHLRDRFADLPWQATRILGALDDAEDIYYESIGQVRTPRWASGRIALLGDAAFRTVLRVAASKPAKKLGAQLFSPPADKIQLPEYEHLVRTVDS